MGPIYQEKKEIAIQQFKQLYINTDILRCQTFVMQNLLNDVSDYTDICNKPIGGVFKSKYTQFDIRETMKGLIKIIRLEYSQKYDKEDSKNV